jgi:hypothetical protein
LLPNPLFSGGLNKMSIDLPFWYNVYDQINIPERSTAHGHYTLFTSVNPISLSTELLADKLYLQIHTVKAMGL